MASVALRIPVELKTMVDKLPWVNWSEIAREEVIERLKLQEEFEEFKRIVSKSKLTEEQAMELARDVKKRVHKRYKKSYPRLK